jgi:hypothetical protein
MMGGVVTMMVVLVDDDGGDDGDDTIVVVAAKAGADVPTLDLLDSPYQALRDDPHRRSSVVSRGDGGDDADGNEDDEDDEDEDGDGDGDAADDDDHDDDGVGDDDKPPLLNPNPTLPPLRPCQARPWAPPHSRRATMTTSTASSTRSHPGPTSSSRPCGTIDPLGGYTLQSVSIPPFRRGLDGV